MRSGNRAESENQSHQHCAGRERIRKQRDRHVAAGKPLAHDAGADDRRQQQRGTNRLCGMRRARVTRSSPERSNSRALSRE